MLLVDDLSNWYVRRSRRRFQKPENKKEKNEASQTLYYVLLNLVKLAAPFIPFITEEIYQKLTRDYCLSESGRPKSKAILGSSLRQAQDKLSSGNNFEESVHLCDYPKAEKKLINNGLEESMIQAREIVALALAQRAAAGIKVRQPLQKLKINLALGKKIKTDQELLELIKDEVNVKEIIFDKKMREKVKLSTKITTQLKEEGMIREIIRQIQDARRQLGLTRENAILLNFQFLIDDFQKLLDKWNEYIKKETLSQKIVIGQKIKSDLEKEIKLEEGRAIKIGIKRVK